MLGAYGRGMFTVVFIWKINYFCNQFAASIHVRPKVTSVYEQPTIKDDIQLWFGITSSRSNQHAVGITVELGQGPGKCTCNRAGVTSFFPLVILCLIWHAQVRAVGCACDQLARWCVSEPSVMLTLSTFCLSDTGY